jgi:hypothetical protein
MSEDRKQSSLDVGSSNGLGYTKISCMKILAFVDSKRNKSAQNLSKIRPLGGSL